ncbi:MAG TPA: GWxTD domain-containing protein [Thermoanaerobaculia bacterium]
MKLSKVALAVLLFVVPLVSGGSTPAGPDDENWANSPEAYFLTAAERKEWDGLRSRDSRVDFIERYWLKRDPTPGTAANEFRDLVLARIRTADQRYRIEKIAGSRTAQGFVFIVFGTPAQVQEQHAPPLPPPRRLAAGDTYEAVGIREGTETTHTWIYDTKRTPKILQALGVPSLSMTFVMEPNRHKDELQNPGLVHEYRERLARKTIVNPDLVPAPAAPLAALAPAAPALSLTPLSAAVRAILEKAPHQVVSEDEKQPVFGSAVLWGARDKPETLAWVFLPDGKGAGEKLTFHALVRGDEGGREISAGSERATASTSLPTARPGRVLVRRFDLPPGNYSASFAVTGEGERQVASGTIPVRVPEIGADFAISSVLVSAGMSPPGKAGDSSFLFGSVEALPRADATFSRAESLWYFVQLANVSEEDKVTQELRLLHGPRTVAVRPASPAQLQEIAPGRYAFGYELPLSSLEPGSYVLYVTVRDGQGHSVLRRADFRVVPAEATRTSANSR